LNFTFAQPELLPLLWVVPALAAFCLFRGWHRGRMQRRLGTLETLERTSRIQRPAFEWVHALCLLVAVAAALLAAAWTSSSCWTLRHPCRRRTSSHRASTRLAK
jgi:hypothetical protein